MLHYILVVWISLTQTPTLEGYKLQVKGQVEVGDRIADILQDFMRLHDIDGILGGRRTDVNIPSVNLTVTGFSNSNITKLNEENLRMDAEFGHPVEVTRKTEDDVTIQANRDGSNNETEVLTTTVTKDVDNNATTSI